MPSDELAGEPARPGPPRPVSAKMLVAGGFGVGKTTFVGAISEIPPLRTEEHMTSSSEGVDDRFHVPDKTTTTVAMDFGRVTADADLVLYLFGTPGQERFGFMWEDLADGALGVVVLADTRRLEDCFSAIDFCEEHDLRFVVAVNQFEGAALHQTEAVRTALDVDDDVPVLRCDARDEESVRTTLRSLLGHILDQIDEPAGADATDPPGPARRPSADHRLSGDQAVAATRALMTEVQAR